MSVVERILRRDAAASGAADADGVSISAMRRRDLKAGVLETERHAYPRPWSVSVFQSEIDQVRDGSRCYLVARRALDDGTTRIAGHAGLWFAVDEAHVTNVAVHPDERRRGIATKLLLALADAAIDRGCEAWTLEVRVSSTGAQELYRTFGFAPAGVRKRYYENSEDAIVMWCHDIQSDDYRSRLDRLKERVA